MEIKGVGAFVILFVGVIVALAILPQIASNTQEMTQKQFVDGETISLASLRVGATGTINVTKNVTVARYPSGWKITECPLTSVVVYNQTGTQLTAGTDYYFSSTTGKISFINVDSVNSTLETNTTAGNSTTIDYYYCGDGYSTSASARSITNLILIVSALALVAFAIFYGTRELS